jgi:hypothetical protein
MFAPSEFALKEKFMTDASMPDTIYDKTIARLCSAIEAHDTSAMVALFAPAIIVRSPITQLIRFEGINQVSELFVKIFDFLNDIRMYEIVGKNTAVQVIFWRGKVGKTYLEEANLIKMNDQGQIAEMTVFMRAIPGLLELLSKIAPSLASRHGWARAAFIKAQLVVLSTVFRLAEPMVIRLSKAGVSVNRERVR